MQWEASWKIFKGFSHFNNFPISCNLFHYIPIKYLEYTKTNLHAVCRYNFVFFHATYNRRIHSYIKLNCIDNKEELASNLHFYFLSFEKKSIWECHENAIFIFMLPQWMRLCFSIIWFGTNVLHFPRNSWPGKIMIVFYFLIALFIEF
jgi:hypothetical protein